MSKRIDWQRLIPRYWLQNCKTDWDWDEILNDLLDRNEVRPSGRVTMIGTVEVWTSNYPYAYGSCHNPKNGGLPSVSTRKRLRAIVEAAVHQNWLSEIHKAVR